MANWLGYNLFSAGKRVKERNEDASCAAPVVDRGLAGCNRAEFPVSRVEIIPIPH